MGKHSAQRFTHAYVSKDSGEICYVEISLGVGKEKIKLIIKPDEQKNIEKDLPEILSQIEKTQLSRIDIKIQNDCEVFIVDKTNPDNIKKIEFIDENFMIREQ